MRDDEFYAYKQRKEDWVTGHNGTTFLEYFFVMAVPMCWMYTMLSVKLALRFAGFKLSASSQFILEYMLLVIPSVMCFTYPERILTSGLLSVGISFVCTLYCRLKMSDTKPFFPRCFEDFFLQNSVKDKCAILNSRRKPFVAMGRGYLILETAIAILAVDFDIFPRRFCKAEVAGWSLMDIGVGMFVFTNGLVYSAKLLNIEASRNRLSSLQLRLKNACISASPLIVLGIVRLLTTRGMEYQSHVTEYGVHWNFFLTLCAISLFATLLDVPTRWAAVVGVVFMFGHQWMLSFFGEEYILTAPRTNLFSMNKEGILSSAGYFAIYLIGVRVGAYLMRYRKHLKEWWTAMSYSFMISFALWSALILSVSMFGLPSRRFVNMSYILTVAAFNIQCLAGYLLIFLMIDYAEECVILRSLNRNSLFIFLVANIATGLINVSMKTLDASPLKAGVIVHSYCFLISLVSVILDGMGITMKFW